MSTKNQLTTQNELLLQNLKKFYENKDYLNKMINIINGESKISLRIVDWFVTNYAKKYFTVYEVKDFFTGNTERFKVYNDYKLKLKAYSKRRFDPFCRWERISFPYDETKFVETTIGQLNFFKWSIENNIIIFIEQNYEHIENDMNSRNTTSKKKHSVEANMDYTKTRKKRQELSVSATKCIKKEQVKILVKFN
jgi:hypothetical protein